MRLRSWCSMRATNRLLVMTMMTMMMMMMMHVRDCTMTHMCQPSPIQSAPQQHHNDNTTVQSCCGVVVVPIELGKDWHMWATVRLRVL